jgi:hypothetical protein
LGRSEDLSELLPYIVERCDYEPPGHQDGAAVCDTCSNVFLILVDRIEDTYEHLH